MTGDNHMEVFILFKMANTEFTRLPLPLLPCLGIIFWKLRYKSVFEFPSSKSEIKLRPVRIILCCFSFYQGKPHTAKGIADFLRFRRSL